MKPLKPIKTVETWGGTKLIPEMPKTKDELIRKCFDLCLEAEKAARNEEKGALALAQCAANWVALGCTGWNPADHVE
jgi:hypothetical protein